MSKIKAIIFDFDGVIVESMDIKAKAFAYLFRDYPEHVEDIVSFHMKHGGMPRFEKFEKIYSEILKIHLSEDRKKNLADEFSQFVFQEVVKCPYVEGAIEFLRANKGKYLFFIVSGTPEDELKSIVNERKLDQYFTEILGSPIKKNVHNSNLMNKYKLKPEEVMFVGDSIDDWEGVKDIGIKFIGRVIDGNPFTAPKVYGIIKNLYQLQELIGNV